MTESEQQKYAYYNKVAWALYSMVAVIVIVSLVVFKAADNEERLFFGLMGSAVFYVFRPTEKFFRKRILKFMNLPEEVEEDEHKK